MFFYAVSDVLDEFLVISDAIRLLIKDVPIILGMGLLVWGMVKWADKRTEREEELARLNDRLETFASVVSHDLRNPLSVAQGYTERAQEETDDIQSLNWVKESLERMDSLIEELLTIARQEEIVKETDSVALEAVTKDAWKTAETKDATLAVEDTVKLEIDQSRVQQLLENLFRNAVDHGSTNVLVTVGAIEDTGFFVEDTGSGVPEDQRDNIFEYGYTTADDGTGFGLAIVKEIVEAHSGSVSVTEGETGGARFEIRSIDMATQ
jgi:signal transduction histidine kinase